jgi:hypothetical protein
MGTFDTLAGNASGDVSGASAAATLDDGTTASEAAGSDSVPGSASTTATLASNTAVRGFVNTNGDQDWYRITLIAGHQYTFELNGFGKGAILDPFLRIFNASGTQLASDDDSGPLAGSKLTFTATASGTYYVSAGGYQTSTGQYLLSMHDGATAYLPAVSVSDIADYLTNTYWEVNGGQARHWGTSTITYNVDGLEPERATLAILAFQTWADVANLTFVQVHATANIMLDDTQSGAYSSSTTSGNLITSSIVNVDPTWYGGIDAVDSYTLQTFIHEIGHAIGLGHAGPYNNTATYGTDNAYANDTWQMSVMSYFDESKYGGDTYRFVMTPEMADIMAVQSMYGAPSTRAADTTYGFGSTAGFLYDFSYYAQAPAFTIYDSGGNDTLNASGYSQNQLIDLLPGSFSNIGGLIGNIGIYLTAVIENAIGGSGNDTIIGNSADNTIRGGPGNDTIDGGPGIDTAVFSGPRAAYTLTALSGTDVRVSGPDGVDTLTNIERLAFDDQTIVWPLATQPDSGVAVGVPHLSAKSDDFNGDGNSDALLRSSDGHLWVNFYSGTTITGSGAAGSPTTDWDVVATADFNGDGHADVALRNHAGGQLWFNFYDGATIIGSGPAGAPTTDWDIAGAGDFNGDGMSDLLLRNHTSGQLWLNMYNGVNIIGSGPAGSPTANWDVAGIGDFNGDGRSDVLLRDHNTGQLRIDLYDGVNAVVSGSAGSPTMDWDVAGIGDFNGDGSSDVLLHNHNTGQLWVNLYNGVSIVSSGFAGSPSTDWDVVRVADYNGDGHSDVMLRDHVDGHLYVNLYSGLTIIGSGPAGSPGTDWHFVSV